MRRRVVAAAVASVLALLGSGVLARYVATADERAMAGMDPVTVLVVAAPIAEGTPAEGISGLVRAEDVPAAATSPGAVTSVDELAGRVAATDLVPGEQVLAHRFVAPDDLTTTPAVEVPPGMHQVTVQLDATRVLGGHLHAGDTVGVFVSREPEPHETRLVLHHVLVTRVQGGVPAPSAAPVADDAAQPEAAEPGAAEPVPAAVVLVTLALDAAAAQTVVFAAEYERIWLSLEAAEAPTGDVGSVTKESVLR